MTNGNFNQSRRFRKIESLRGVALVLNKAFCQKNHVESLFDSAADNETIKL